MDSGRVPNVQMSWAAAVLSLRCLNYTPERWDQFWSKVDQYGFPVAA